MVFSLLNICLALSMASSKLKRNFQFVKYGAKFDSPTRPTISCDGRIEGVTLELTHWNGNQTPDRYYADTSTEMALKLPQDCFIDAVILNNHYDSDGVLSVFACLEPEIATRYAELLVAGAEAGDFGEWSSDAGIKLDSCISGLLDDKDEETSYRLALKELPAILDDLTTAGGTTYEHLWKTPFEHACQCYDMFTQGIATARKGPGRIVIVQEPEPLSAYAIHRHLVESDLLQNTNRVLRVTGGGAEIFRYRYEKPGHGWVQKLVKRTPIPNVDAVDLVDKLNTIYDNEWKTGGPAGLVSICQSVDLDESPDDVAEALVDLDEGAR
jgi:hypothetical protein